MVARTEKLGDALRYAEKAAGIRIIDRRPEEALRVLDKALSRPDAKAIPEKDIRAIALLRARAKAKSGSSGQHRGQHGFTHRLFSRVVDQLDNAPGPSPPGDGARVTWPETTLEAERSGLATMLDPAPRLQECDGPKEGLSLR